VLCGLAADVADHRRLAVAFLLCGDGQLLHLRGRNQLHPRLLAQVTFHYQNSKSKRYEFRTLPGAQFLWLVLQHILPKGFRRARNFGFLHPNSKQLIQVIQYRFGVNINRALGLFKKRVQWLCPCCKAKMKIIKTQIPVQLAKSPLPLEVGGSH